jgi:hypothetical protein
MRFGANRWPVGVFLLILCATHASADPIRVTRDNREVLTRALVFNTSGLVGASSSDNEARQDSLAASAEAVLGETITRADSRLVSTIAPGMHHLEGFGRTSSSIVGPRGDTVATALFELAAPLAYRFTGTFDGGAGVRANWQTHLSKQVGEFRQSLRFSFNSNMGPQHVVNEGGSLDPGRYFLTVRSDAAATTMFGDLPNTSSNFDFAFDLRPVPEPASILLLTGGVGGVLACARRGRKAR